MTDTAARWRPEYIVPAVLAIARRPARGFVADITALCFSVDMSGTGAREQVRSAITAAREELRRKERL